MRIDKKFPKACGAVVEALHEVERGGEEVRRHQNPLLVSVRSGAAFSMPGMMDHGPESRPQRRDCAGISRADGRSAVRLDAYRRFASLAAKS